MKIGVFFQRQIPHVEDLAVGAERLGWDVDLKRVKSGYEGGDYDVVAIGGHLDRYDGLNGRIFGHYRNKNTPVFVVEMGRMLRPDIEKHKYWFFYLNGSPSRPLLVTEKDYDVRRRMLFPEVRFLPRGEDVVVIGQDREVDARMHATTLLDIRQATDRKIVWRPRPQKAPGGMPTSKFCDETSDLSLEEDFKRAWCVVAYTSNAAGEAIARGIPVICHHSASYAYLCSQSVMDIDTIKPLATVDVVNYFRSMAQITWSNDEMKTGAPLHWFESTRQIAPRKSMTIIKRPLDHYDVTLFTCTGGRQQTFSKLEEYVERQTLRPKRWVIVDDVEEATEVRPHLNPDVDISLIRRAPFWKPGEMTYHKNFLQGLKYIDGGKWPGWVVMFEDDDWYHPEYLEHYIPLFETLKDDGILMGGEFANIYYHVGLRHWKRVGMAARNATMAATFFHMDLIPTIRQLLGSYTGLSLDLQMFHNIPQNQWRVYDTDYVVGIKGTPATRSGGTYSHGVNHVARAGWKPDMELEKLKEWIGDDVSFYEPFYEGTEELERLRRKFRKHAAERQTQKMKRYSPRTPKRIVKPIMTTGPIEKKKRKK